MSNQQQFREVQASIVPDDAYVLDVREPEEWDAGHTPGAHHVPMMQVPARIGDLPTDREIVVLCRHGHRSAQVAMYLGSQGLTNVVNLEGGIVEWVAAGRPIVTDDGRDPFIA